MPDLYENIAAVCVVYKDYMAEDFDTLEHQRSFKEDYLRTAVLEVQPEGHDEMGYPWGCKVKLQLPMMAPDEVTWASLHDAQEAIKDHFFRDDVMGAFGLREIYAQVPVSTREAEALYRQLAAYSGFSLDGGDVRPLAHGANGARRELRVYKAMKLWDLSQLAKETG